MKLRCLLLGRKAMTNRHNLLDNTHITLLTKAHSHSYGFSSSQVEMWELDHKEGWALNNWCFQAVELEKTLESPLYSKEIKPVNSKGNQHWIFIGRTDAEAPTRWPPDMKSQLTAKDPDAGKDRGQEAKGVTVDEMVWWHHCFNGHEFEQSTWSQSVRHNLPTKQWQQQNQVSIILLKTAVLQF